MSAVTAVITDRVITAVHKSGPIGTINRIEMDIACHNGATQVAGASDTLDVVMSTAATHALRSGQTLTPRSVKIKQCAQSSATEYAATVTISSSTISIVPKATSDWSTNATISASALVGYVPYIISVLCDVT